MPRPVDRFLEHVRGELASIEAEGLTKRERAITSQQQADIEIEIGDGPERRRVLNLCANNYLGLANHPDVMAAAKAGIDRYGFGVASVRFICGTQDLHHALEGASRPSWAPMPRSCTRAASTPTPGSSRRCSGPRTPSSPTR
jgi:hypothetical protein